jgi:uroporphyrinogen decarboxylase
MTTMTKIERVRAALSGADVDRPPFSAWYHFGLQHAPAERTAQVHVEFFEAYNLDWLKVMNDYSYPMPRAIETLTDPRDLKRITALDVRQGTTGEQLEVIRLIGQSLRGKALVVDTVFNAWNTLKRNVLKDAMGPFMQEQPAALEAALGVVNDNLIRYAIASLHGGASGIFYSVPATSESLTLEQYERFMRPFDLAFLETIRPFGEFHILHAHGKELYLDRLQEYPAHAISWADRETGPSLAQMRRLTPRALMGGIGHTNFPYTSAATIREQIRTAVQEAGPRKLLITPGCAIPSYSFPELIRAARAEVGKD